MNVVDFIARFGDVYAQAWECDAVNKDKCTDNFRKHGIEYTLVEKAMYDREETLRFKSDRTDSCVCDDGDVMVTTGRIDDYLGEQRIGIIKMDIEGCEYNALLGARETIMRDAPVLAISVYHKLEDIIELPLLIGSMYPSYRYFLRHYAFSRTDTILYAIPESAF